VEAPPRFHLRIQNIYNKKRKKGKPNTKKNTWVWTTRWTTTSGTAVTLKSTDRTYTMMRRTTSTAVTQRSTDETNSFMWKIRKTSKMSHRNKNSSEESDEEIMYTNASGKYKIPKLISYQSRYKIEDEIRAKLLNEVEKDVGKILNEIEDIKLENDKLKGENVNLRKL
jgi:hypothetical protein